MRYNMYYRPSISFVFQYGEEFTYSLLHYYRYFSLKFRVYEADKTRIPAISIELILFGVGFELFSHVRL